MARQVETLRSAMPTPVETRDNIKVAAYCRVSNDKLEDSLEVQKAYFEKKIKDNPRWTLVEVYHDDGISGTTIDQRPDFNRLLEDCRKKKVDFILVKELSRFTRNMRDALNIFDELASLNIFVKFEADNLCTQNSRDMDYLRRCAEQAEYEVRRTSSRVIFSQTFKVENGIEFGHGMLGYIPVNGKMQIVDNEEEVEIVKYIFTEYANGKGSDTICKELKKKYPDFRPEYTKGTKLRHTWSSAKIRRILQNEKYVGDFIFRKSYVSDTMTHKQIKNDIYKEDNKRHNHDQIYVKDNHPAIIDRDTWDTVQERFKLYNEAKLTEKKIRHSNRYWSSGKVYCDKCKGHFVSTNKKTKSGYHQRWRCYTNSRFGKDECSSVSISTNVLNAVMWQTINQINLNKDKIKAEIEKEISKIKNSDINKIGTQIKKLEAELDSENNKFNYYNTELATLNSKKASISDEYEVRLINARIANYNKNLESTFAVIQELEKKIISLKEQDNEKALIEEQEAFKKMLDEFFAIDPNADNSILYASLCDKIIVNTDLNQIEVFLNNFPNSFTYKYATKGALDNYEVLLEEVIKE